MQKLIKYISFIFLCMGSISCKKFVAVTSPATVVESEKLFSDDASANAATAGVYAQMGASYLTLTNGGLAFYTGLTSDELTCTYANAELLSFQTNSILPDNGFGIYGRLWKPAYQVIYGTNAVLEGVRTSTMLSKSVKEKIEGEMLVTRALVYFNLSGIFGDVPLVLETFWDANNPMKRTPVIDIFQQLSKDLIMAQQLLGESNVSDNFKPNKAAATALLARLYLYQQDYQKAEQEASSLLETADYSLEEDLSLVFEPGSRETIWQLGNDYSNTAEASSFIPYSNNAVPDFTLTDYLVNSFESGDQRLAKWTGKNEVNGTVYYYPFKYRDNNYQPVTEYEVLLRLSEMYLIRAEARARQEELTAATADLNKIRQRAGLVILSNGSQAQLLEHIVHERQIEFFLEGGHRWFDLKRTGEIDKVLGQRKAPNWQPEDALFPLPSYELQLNHNLEQNPGY